MDFLQHGLNQQFDYPIPMSQMPYGYQYEEQPYPIQMPFMVYDSQWDKEDIKDPEGFIINFRSDEFRFENFSFNEDDSIEFKV